MRLVFATVALGVMLGAVTLADPPTVKIDQRATSFLAAVEVTIDVNCGDGPTRAVLEVNVRQGDSNGANVFPFEATGDPQEIDVLVPGPFELGDASASAALFCGAMLAGLDLGEIITIVEP